MRYILIGNTYPMALVQRDVSIRPTDKKTLLAASAERETYSFWGHPETLRQVEAFLGLDLTPREPRPAVTLDENGFPSLYGLTFRECWIVTPVPVVGLRPPAGGGMPVKQIIRDWRVLRMTWL